MIYLSGNHPFLRLKINLPKDRWKTIECLIDTGFSGGVSLPQKFRKYFFEDKFVETRFALADGSEIITDATYTKVEYNRKLKDVNIVFIGNSGCLVGVEFLNHMKFCFDFEERKVSLE